MKYINEFRDPSAAQRLLRAIAAHSTRPVCLMEFCGGHTHAILKFGLRQLLPPTVRLLSGPGCPVCVTADADLDRAVAVAQIPGVILATFGDMLRVPGSQGSLQEAKAQGADVRMVYSPLDALTLASANPRGEVVFLAIGFETTAPAVATTVLEAQRRGVGNFSVLSLHKLTPPATRAILEGGELQLSGVVGPGHVSTIIGEEAWAFLPTEYSMPIAIAGFEPLDILQAISALVDMIEVGAPAVSNAYPRSVRPQGNRVAQEVMRRVFQIAAAEWRGLGVVPASGLALRREYAALDASQRFPVTVAPSSPAAGCLCGEVLRGIAEPRLCPLFLAACTPEHPVGPCMVSNEGACAAYAQYGEG